MIQDPADEFNPIQERFFWMAVGYFADDPFWCTADF